MTLQEAIKSGKRFKRPTWSKYIEPNQSEYTFFRKHILADDWEVEPVKKELSARDIFEALKTVQLRRHRRIIDHPMRDSLELDTVTEMLKELGL